MMIKINKIQLTVLFIVSMGANRNWEVFLKENYFKIRAKI